MTEIREFKCRECGHTVVVHPDLPPDYTPTICNQCAEPLDAARNFRIATLMAGFVRLVNRIKSLGDLQ